MKRKTLWISIIGILLIGFVCLFCYQHYIRQKQIEQKKHTGLVSEDFPVQDIKHQSLPDRSRQPASKYEKQ